MTDDNGCARILLALACFWALVMVGVWFVVFPH
jgi:hypothetical protein